jgi:tetratricopeptide (TPR) repeat protein
MGARVLLIVLPLLAVMAAVPATAQEKAARNDEIVTQVNAAMSAKDWKRAKDLLPQLIAGDPDRWEYYQWLGNAQLNLGEHADAATTYAQGIRKAEIQSGSVSDPDKAKALRAGIGQMLVGQGNAYLKLRRTDEAMAAYGKAAEADPNPGLAYFNLCATAYNLGNMERAAQACEKSIQADPGRADAYFIKGSVLFARGTLDKQGKYLVPPGTVEALRKYLELAPNGSHANDVKAMLEASGAALTPTPK